MNILHPKVNSIFNTFIKEDIIELSEYGNGHINNTYLIKTNHNHRFILQEVNSKVFNINNLIDNYDNLIKLLGHHNNSRIIPEYLINDRGSTHSIDNEGKCWRLCKYIADSITYDISPSVDITEKAGHAMGKFQLRLNTLNTKLFADTIIGFHDPSNRMNSFDLSLKNTEKKLIDTALQEINFVIENKWIADRVSSLLISKKLPQRITHNDPKLENILFTKNRSNTYIIDLDTIMKGSIIFDFGDMVRSITSLSSEDENDLSKVKFDLDHFEALARGYLCEIKSDLEIAEKENILSGIYCIVFIQGVRFLTDYLNGNKYYKVSNENQNLQRCRTQFTLLAKIMANENSVKQILTSFLK